MFKNKLRSLPDGTMSECSEVSAQLQEVEAKEKAQAKRRSARAKVLRVDPTSNYQLKSKYISQDPIMEESLE